MNSLSRPLALLWIVAFSVLAALATATVQPASAAAKPALKLTPGDGLPGILVTAAASEFRGDQPVEFHWKRAEGDLLSSPVTADSKGNAIATFNVPVVQDALYDIWAVQGKLSAKATFHVKASLSIDPTSGPAGIVATVRGVGFQPAEQIEFRWNSAHGQLIPNPNPVVADGETAFQGSITIPATGSKSTTIWAVGAKSGIAAPAPFALVGLVTLQLSPVSGHVGDSVTVTGGGFLANEPISMKWDSQDLGASTTDAAGNFSATITVPSSPVGGSKLSVTGGTSLWTAQATFDVINSAPGLPKTATAPTRIPISTSRRKGCSPTIPMRTGTH